MLTLTILGNNSAIPAYGRHPTAQLLQYEDEGILIDCGEGTQMQISKYKIKSSKINRILISHLHGDHYFGLIGLLTTMSLMNRKEALHIHAPVGLQQIIDIHLQVADMHLGYPLAFYPITEEGLLAETKKLTIDAFKVSHRIECWGFLIREKKKPRRIDKEKAYAAGVPEAYFEKLQSGEDYIDDKGTTVSNDSLTTPAAAPRSYAYCADTMYDEGIAKKVSQATLLYHETTYLKDAATKAAERFHSTTEQAARLAKLAQAEQLIIGHFSAKYESLEPFLAEAKSIFKNTALAIEGTCFKV